MNSATALELERIGGPDLKGPLRGPYEIGAGLELQYSRAVYIILDAWGKCSYVGKVCSDADVDRLQARLAEHLRTPAKMHAFHMYYVMSFRRGVSNARIEKTEGWVAKHMRPYLSKRSPNPRTRSRRARRQV